MGSSMGHLHLPTKFAEIHPVSFCPILIKKKKKIKKTKSTNQIIWNNLLGGLSRKKIILNYLIAMFVCE